MQRPADAVLAPGWRFLVAWTTAWAAVGVAVAAGISFGAGVELGPVLRLKVCQISAITCKLLPELGITMVPHWFSE